MPQTRVLRKALRLSAVVAICLRGVRLRAKLAQLVQHPFVPLDVLLAGRHAHPALPVV